MHKKLHEEHAEKKCKLNLEAWSVLLDKYHAGLISKDEYCKLAHPELFQPDPTPPHHSPSWELRDEDFTQPNHASDDVVNSEWD